MRLAFVTLMKNSPWGGSEELWFRTAQLALRDGHPVLVLAYANIAGGERAATLASQGARVCRLDGSRGRSFGSRLKRRLAPPLRSVVAFAPDSVLVNCGATYCWTKVGGFEGAYRELIANGAGVHFLCHSSDDARRPSDRDAALARRVWAQARTVEFSAPELHELAERQVLARISNAIGFVNPVNLRKIEILAWPVTGAAAFATVCRLGMAKGVDLALRAFAQPQWRDRAWRYEVYGTGPDQAYLAGLAEYLGIAKQVRFVGHAADLREVWERNHVMVLTSRNEGLPLTLVEASICGRPSILTDVGGIRRWAADGDFAFIAAAPSLHAVSAAFESAWNAMPRWRELGVRASRHAIAWHGADPAAALLRRLADGSAPGRAAPSSRESPDPTPGCPRQIDDPPARP